VLLPTDTVYGLAVHPGLEAAIDRLFRLKDRPRSRNLPVIVSSEADARDIGCVITEAASRLLTSEFVPGPLTLALGLEAEKRPGWLAGRDEVAVRIPAERFLLDLVTMTGPLLVTSANRHAEDPGESVADILPRLHGEPDFVVDDGPRATVPSTLVNCRLDPPVVERVGAVPAEAVEKVLLR
jgi:L-threonylcarbamoyladenylate synthase